MMIDTSIVIFAGVILLVTCLTPMLSPFSRFLPKRESEEDTDVVLPPLTILVTPHKQSQELEKNIPNFLLQDYPAGIEIIIVAEKGDKETEDVISRLTKDKRIYATYVPESSRYVSRKKLAVTLGVRAAHNEWIVMTDASSVPASNQWLKLMGEKCQKDKDMVIGYSNYNQDAPRFYRFERLYTALYLLRESYKTAYRTNGTNLFFRKSLFTDGEGYRGNLDVIRGEYDFLVNKFARPFHTAVVTAPDAWVLDAPPLPEAWLKQQLHYMHIRRILRRKYQHRFLPYLDQIAFHVNNLIILLAFSYSFIIIMRDENLYDAGLLGGTSIFAAFASYFCRCYKCARIVKYFEKDISPWVVPFYEIRILWHRIYTLFRYWSRDEIDFSTHKI